MICILVSLIKIARADGNNWYVSYSGNTSWVTLNNFNDIASNLLFGDFNGDGKTDVLKSLGGNWYISFGGNSIWQQWKTSNYTINQLSVGDFDGDGKSDIFRSAN